LQSVFLAAPPQVPQHFLAVLSQEPVEQDLLAHWQEVMPMTAKAARTVKSLFIRIMVVLLVVCLCGAGWSGGPARC